MFSVILLGADMAKTSNTSDIVSPLLSPRDAAAFLGYKNFRSITRLVSAGYLKPVYLPNRVHPKYLRADLEALISETPYDQPMGYQKRKNVNTHTHNGTTDTV
jgi:hypothetical protein